MNFKKNKDVKRASYYVWFLGAKESKGLRGDEYVTPVLNYLLDNECELEPSKVTLQVSNKGLKIIQILTVPRKSAKLNADQQLQLFANGLRAPGAKGDPGQTGSSVLKTEQVKHHIPHNSITWVYQDEDVICAILLLYNPLTRCPVHVHAYRCDSIETANNLRQQLQTLVDRPENQKKFREIESRLAAKGLLVPPQPSTGYANYEYSAESSLSPRYHPHHSPTTSKTLNSDGRSTRTEASDENSEESNSSDLGYAIRSKSSHSSSSYKQHAPPPPPPIHSIPPSRPDRTRHQSHSPPRHSEHLFKSKPKSSSKMDKPKRQSVPDEPEVPSGVTAALYDSLAAELRAKLGNPKMGPLLLPPRDYDNTSGIFAVKQAMKQQRQKTSCPLTRSESSGKSSSGIGSDEALAGEMPKRSHHYRSDYESDKRYGPQSLGNLPKPYRFGDNEKQLYSLQGPAMYSSEEEDFDPNDRRHTPEEDTEDIEEDVIFTAHVPRSKSTFDLRDNFESSKSSRTREHYAPPSSSGPVSQHAARYYHRQSSSNGFAQHPPTAVEPDRKKVYASNPNLARDSRAPVKEVNRPTDKSVVGRREQRSSGISSRPPTHAPAPSKPKSIQQFYFADSAFANESPKHSSGRDREPPAPPSNLRRQMGRSSGNLANLEYSEAVSLGYHPGTERALSPPYQYRYEPKSYVPSPSSSKPSVKPSNKAIEIDRSRELARKRFEQPYSRFSYIEVDHNRHESRFGLLGAIRR